MPVFDLGRLGRMQISYLPPSDIPQGDHQDIPSGPPPECTNDTDRESDTKYHVPSQAQPPECKTKQVCRWLIEIFAITFNANFDELNAALYDIPVPDNTNTILCDSERADLVAQSDLVRKMHRWYLGNKKTRIYRKEELALCDTIIQPVSVLDELQGTWPHFALDMIGWYGEEERRPSDTRWATTIPALWAADTRYSSWGRREQLETNMRTWRNVLEDAAPNDKVRDVLREAWDDYRRRFGLGELSRNVICRPLREGYFNMGDALWSMGQWVVVDSLGRESRSRISRRSHTGVVSTNGI